MKRQWTLLFSLFLIVFQGQVASVEKMAGFAWPVEWQADSAFYRLWSVADAPVGVGRVSRSWVWGPVPFAVANEQYAESSTGRRLVQYLDKARMEVNDPLVDHKSQWYITSGLLVNEMVSGQMQTGNNLFEHRAPSDLPVAGDLTSPNAPTYATFAGLRGQVPSVLGSMVKQRLSRDGTLTTVASGEAPTDVKLFGMAAYDDVTRHHIPGVFLDWMRQSGVLLEGGHFVQGAFMDPLYLLGRPITEPYWADVVVGGSSARVLIQLYERRALTYNPTNAPEWRVEMANVGRAYYDWRYRSVPPGPAISGEVSSSGLLVRGWNWDASASVAVDAILPGGASTLTPPQEVKTDASGRFSILLATTPDLQGALQAGANVQLVASATSGTVSLPVGGKMLAGKVKADGIITQLSGLATPIQTLHLKAPDGQDYTVTVGSGSRLLYSEGDSAPSLTLQPGTLVNLEGMAVGGVVSAETIRLLSVSRTGASLSYEWSGNGNTLIVSGTNWPGEHQVSLSSVARDGRSTALAIARSDSRGNLLLQLPHGPQASPSWLAATCVEGAKTLASVARPLTGREDPPSLFAISEDGEQMGNIGNFCHGPRCTSALGVPLSADKLLVTPGELLGLRSQRESGTNAGITPLSIVAKIYSLNEQAGQLATLDGTEYFEPTSQPLFTTGEIPGRPFSVALPPSLQSGRYALILKVVWPDASTGKVSADYGFAVQVR